MISVMRIFHPIGQGAFYSERHGDFNVVFDCGEIRRNSKSVDAVVRQSFGSSETIDLLFISHFDSDHVNRIPLLLKHCSGIKKVILPALHDDLKILLTSYYKIEGRPDLEMMVQNPQEFFGENAVVEVEQTEEPDSPDEREVVYDDEMLGSIKSGVRIIRRGFEWEFIPHNYNNQSVNITLKRELKTNGLDANRMKADVAYCMQNEAKIRSVYQKLTLGINKNSMTVYSGARVSAHKRLCFQMLCHPVVCGITHYLKQHRDKHVGCVYTGDIDLKKTDIKRAYRLEWNEVGTIQIPHHGSAGSHERMAYSAGGYVCPVSFGSSNKYGHPSTQVVSELIKLRNMPIAVTDSNGSAYYEWIIG